jgi:hypothetical protein
MNDDKAGGEFSTGLATGRAEFESAGCQCIPIGIRHSKIFRSGATNGAKQFF